MAELRLRSVLLGLTLFLRALPGAGQLEADTRLVVIAPEADDPRIELVAEAVAFWASTFAELGLEPVFGEPELQLADSSTRALENYAWQLSRSAGRNRYGGGRPAPPPELSAIGGGVVLLLTRQALMPLAWPLEAELRYFVAIPPMHGSSDAPAHELRIIAHELGHTLGLEHGGSSAELMCMPCDELSEESRAGAALLELAGDERARLADLYSRSGE